MDTSEPEFSRADHEHFKDEVITEVYIPIHTYVITLMILTKN